ncbi:MAG: phosphate ABC transporter permease PstA [Chloroflexi bacterium]|nr:phosphate ABC transporter permease PstA [Chloroflexota bacterium]
MLWPVLGPRLTFRQRLGVRKTLGRAAYVFLLGTTLVGIATLAALLLDILLDGLPWLSVDFFTNYPSRHPEQAGIRAALFGTLWMAALTALLCFPIGVATAVYLEEYTSQNWLSRIFNTNISNLAGVPSIVYGLLGLAIFVHTLSLGRSVLAGALTMTLLVLPVVIVSAQEAIRAVPDAHRQGAYALGATKWQTVRNIVLPAALPGILTGTILAMARAVGEAAPMIAIAALVYLTFTPVSPLDRFTVLPIQIFNWVSRPQAEWQGVAAAAIGVLLVLMLGMNAAAILLRNKYQRRSEE